MIKGDIRWDKYQHEIWAHLKEDLYMIWIFNTHITSS